MLQNANYAGLLTSLPTVEEVLTDYAPELGHDLTAYRNRAIRSSNRFGSARWCRTLILTNGGNDGVSQR